MTTKFRMMQPIGLPLDVLPVKVTHFYMLQNGWEVYELILEDDEGNEVENPKGLIFTLTVGNETEFGYHDKNDMLEVCMHHTNNLHDVLAAPEWEWVGVH